MTQISRETVIIVHGTWAAPREGDTSWYQPVQNPSSLNFASRLNIELEKKGSPARCWAHCENGDTFFRWSGKNDWIDRSLAATELATTINSLQSEGWRVHVVAHSHGGNVALEALPSVNETLATPFGISGTITTLGTPFIDAMSSVDLRIEQLRRNAASIALFFYFILCLPILLMIALGSAMNGGGVPHIAGVFAPITEFLAGHFVGFSVVFAAVLFSAGYWALRRSSKMRGWKQYWDELGRAQANRKFLLVLNSSMDEAWQLLHHLNTIESPLRPKSGLVRDIWNSRHEYLRKSCEVEYIHGVGSFSRQPGATKITLILSFMLLALGPAKMIFEGDKEPTRDEIRYNVHDVKDFLQAHNVPTSKQLDAAFNEHDKYQVEYLVKPIVEGRGLQDFDPKRFREQERRLNDTIEAEIKKLPAAEQTAWRDHLESKRQESRWEGIVIVASLSILAWLLFVSIASFFLGYSFYSAAFAPLRWLTREAKSLIAAPRFVSSYIVRRNLWPFLQQSAMGLSGYNHKLPSVEKIPAYAPESCLAYEDLPEGAELRAVERRKDWVSRHFGDMTNTLSKLVVTSADIESLQRLVESDLSLVHAAYYTDAECIERVASWISNNGANSKAPHQVDAC